MDVLFAGVPVRDFDLSCDWFGRLFGRPADVVAHDHEVMWRVADGGWLYIVRDPDRAGRSLVAVAVADLDAAVAELTDHGLHPGPIEPEGDGARKSKLKDPDGNLVALIEVAH
jgi:predicted enzyme related to lactoylglutathione lyase